jgi:hypothetical protein
MNISRSYVSRIETKALGKLAKEIEQWNYKNEIVEEIKYLFYTFFSVKYWKKLELVI